MLRCQQGKTPSQPCMAGSSCATVPPSPPPSLHSSSASYHSCQQLIQERAKAPAVSCFGGLHDPPHFCRKSQRGIRAGGRECQWLCRARHILLPAEAPPLAQLAALGRGQEKAGDVSLTWGTVQLFLRLAAALGLHLCPLAKEGETDMTCRAAPEPKAGRLSQS